MNTKTDMEEYTEILETIWGKMRYFRSHPLQNTFQLQQEVKERYNTYIRGHLIRGGWRTTWIPVPYEVAEGIDE